MYGKFQATTVGHHGGTNQPAISVLKFDVKMIAFTHISMLFFNVHTNWYMLLIKFTPFDAYHQSAKSSSITQVPLSNINTPVPAQMPWTPFHDFMNRCHAIQIDFYKKFQHYTFILCNLHKNMLFPHD